MASGGRKPPDLTRHHTTGSIGGLTPPLAEDHFVCQSLTPFTIDHVIAQKHGGPTVLDNLAWACSHCNEHKGPNLAGLDPETGQVIRLFHPRRDIWEDHLIWDGVVLRGLTAVGRTTIVVLVLNHPDFINHREALRALGYFPY